MNNDLDLKKKMLEENDIEEDVRELPSVNTAKKSNGALQKLLFVVLLVGVIAALAAVNGLVGGDKKEDKPNQRADRVGSNLPPPPDLPKQPAPPKEEPVAPPVIETGKLAPPPQQAAPVRLSQGQGKHEMTSEERKMLPVVVAFSGSSSGASLQPDLSPDRRPDNGFATEGESADLGAKLAPVRVAGSRASVLQDRSFFLTQGQFLDCVLETAIDSTVSGMVRARLSRSTYSADGKMILMERGTKIVGQYQRGMKQGEARLFVLWTRAETPTGVLINLDSPGADELGRAGFDGYIDTHFFERFGAAIMFSLIDDVGQYLIDLSKDSKDPQTLSLDSSGDTAKETAGIALENSINIPPTLRKNHGDAISIYVARDLDFRGVYEIEFE